jgi:hypothetical protein
MADTPETKTPLSIEEQLSQIQTTLKGIIGSNINPLQILNTLYDIDNQAMKVAKSMGVGAENASNITKNISASVKEVRLLGGTFEDVVKVQLGAVEALGRNLVLSDKIYEGFVATVKVTGQETPKLVTAFKDIGISTYSITEQMEDVVNSARAIGVNAKAVSDTVVKNIGALNMYNFKGGVEGLAKMAAQATNLRIDMSKTLDFAEKVYNPEAAIETAAALQRLGVVQSDLLDPLRLMDLSQNNPAELQNQLVEMSKQFVKLNEQGRFEIMPGEQRRLREISKELNISYDQLTRMAIGASELDDKMKKISFPDTFDEDQKKMIANLAEMDKEGKGYKITISGEELGLDEAINKLSSDEKLLNKFMKDQKPINMEDLAKEQLSFIEGIAADVNSLTGRVPFGIAGSDNANQLLRSFGQGLTKFVEGTNEIIGTNKQITKGFDDIYKKTNESITEYVTEFFSISNSLIDNLKLTLPNAIVKGHELIKEKGIVGAAEEIITGNNTTEVQDFIKLPGEVIQPLPQDTLFGGTGFEEMMSRIASVTNTQKNNTETSTPQNTTTTADINVNFKFDVPPQIDTNQLLLALNTTDFKQTIIKTVVDAFNPDETSPTKKMNSFTRT